MRKDQKFRILMTGLTAIVVASLLLSAGTINAQDKRDAKSATVSAVSSTVPSNGDINPNRGSILVSNINASNNFQGYGDNHRTDLPNRKFQPVCADRSHNAPRGRVREELV